MSTNKIRPKILIRIGRQNQPLRIDNFDLFIDAQQSFLFSDIANGVSSFSVQNPYGFAVNQILYIGIFGNEGSEFIKTHAATAPSGQTIALASNTLYSHNASDQVAIVPFDQVEISYSATLTGAKSILTTQNIDVASETIYNDTTQTNGYYFARFKNSITNAYSSYSDPASVAGYAMNSARYIIGSARAEINKPVSEIMSDEFGFMQINKAQMETLRELKRWSWMQVFGATTECSVGQFRIPCPNDIDDTNSNKSTLNFRIGVDPNMTFVTKEEFDSITQGMSWTSLASTLNVSDATVTLSDSSNFDSSGTIQIGDDTLSYTANNTSTGVLTLSSVSSVTYPSGQDLFQGASYGTPYYFTINTGYIWNYPIADTLHDKKDNGLDYYAALTPITQDSDTIVVPDPVMIIDYLRWKYIKRINNGEETQGSLEAKQCFLDRKKKLVQKEVMSGKKITLKPRMNDYRDLMNGNGDSKQIRTQGFYPNW